MITNRAVSWLDKQRDKNPGPETRAIQIRNLRVRTARVCFDKVT
jgi:hypothetical protein